LVDIERRHVACLRLAGQEYAVVADARGTDSLTHPD